MTTKTWTGSASTDWFTAANWTGGVPGSGDDAVIGTTAIAPTIGGTPSITVNTLTINGSDTLTVGDANSGGAVFLTATKGISLSGGGAILGQGEITGNVTATGAATIGVERVNTQNTPQLEFFGTITDTGNALTLLISDDLDELIFTKGGAAHAVNFNGHKGELDIFNSTLTIGSQMAVGAGTVFLDTFSTLTDTAGVTLGTGTVVGLGTLAAPVTATGAGLIMAQFGTLEVSGAITDTGNALALAISETGDSLLLDHANKAAAHSANLNNITGMLELNGVSLTVGSQMAIGASTVKLDGGKSALIDTAGATITNGTITGSGLVSAGLTAGTGAMITATGGTLELGGPVTDAGSSLTLTINSSSDKLLIDSAVVADTVSFNNASGTLEIKNTGTLTDTSNLVIGTGKVKLDGTGAVLNDLTESISTGTIIGAGLVTGVITASGAAQITANGGRLELANQLTDSGNALTLTIAGNSDELQLDFSATAHAVTFNGKSGTLALRNQGGVSFTIGTQLAVGTGSVQVESSIYTLADAAGITLSGGAIVGTGSISGALSGAGTVTAFGGTLDLQTAISVVAGPTFQIVNGSNNILQVDSTVGTGNTFRFLGHAGELVVGNGAGFNGSITGFIAGDEIQVKNFVAVSKSFANNALVLTDAGNAHISLAIQGNFQTSDFSLSTVGATSTLVQLVQPAAPSQSLVVLNNFGWQQGWGNPNDPRLISDMDGNGSSDYVGFGDQAVFISYGGTFANGQAFGPGFSPAVASVQDFGIDEGYAANVQRGVAATGAGVGSTIYGQGFAGVYWYAATGSTLTHDAIGNTFSVLQFQNTPNLYGNFGSQQGWTPDNGFQIARATSDDLYSSILGFGAAGIVVGAQAFAPGATAANSYVIPFAAGNNFGWDQQVDVRTFTDGTSNTIDLNLDGTTDFVGMGPQGLVYAYGNTSGVGGAYELGPLQTAHINGSNADLGDAQGWNNATTPRDVVKDPQSGYDDIIAFGAAGVYVTMGQNALTHGGEPFGQLYLAMPDFGSNQGWSVSQTPRIVGDVNGDGIPDIVGFGANSTFVAIGSRDGSGNLHFALDPTRTINDFGYNENWSGANPQTIRTLGDVAGSGHTDLILSGAFNTQVWQYG